MNRENDQASSARKKHTETKVETIAEAIKRTGNFHCFTRNKPTQVTNCSLTYCRIKLVAIGILQIEPDSSHDFTSSITEPQSIIISCGIHGNETAPIEIVDSIINEIMSGQLIPRQRLLFIIGNPAAMQVGSRFIDENLNRLFNVTRFLEADEQHQSMHVDTPITTENYEQSRASEITQSVKSFFGHTPNNQNLHYDLHTAIRPSTHKKFAIYPYHAHNPRSEAQLQFLKYCGIEAILFSHKPANTFSFFSSQYFNAHAFTIELGKVFPFGKNDMHQYRAITRCLQQLIRGEPVTEGTHKDTNHIEQKHYKVCHEIIKTSNHFIFHVANDVANFTTFPQNTLLSEDINESYRTVGSNEAIVFPNADVPIGQRVALVISPDE